MACWRSALTPQPGCSPRPACPRRWTPGPLGVLMTADTRPSLGTAVIIFPQPLWGRRTGRLDRASSGPAPGKQRNRTLLTLRSATGPVPRHRPHRSFFMDGRNEPDDPRSSRPDRRVGRGMTAVGGDRPRIRHRRMQVCSLPGPSVHGSNRWCRGRFGCTSYRYCLSYG